MSKTTICTYRVSVFLAVQDSSIGDLVTHSLTHSVSQRLLISATSEHYNDNNHYNHYNHYNDYNDYNHDTTVTLQ